MTVPGRHAAPPRVAGDYAAGIVAQVEAIPRGLVVTYRDLDPRAPRAAGRVLAAGSPGIPWHRVVRSDGSLALGQRQLELLRAEGVPIRGNRVDMAAAAKRWAARRNSQAKSDSSS